MINLNKVKSWLISNWALILLVVVALFYLQIWDDNRDLELSTKELKKGEMKSKAEAERLLVLNKNQKKAIDSLEALKQEVIKEIQIVKVNTAKEVAIAKSITLEEAAKYYKKRYKEENNITSYGLSLNEKTIRSNIIELIEGEGCKEELKNKNIVILIEEKKGIKKDTIINNLEKSVLELKDANEFSSAQVRTLEATFKRENKNKIIYKGTAVAAIIAAFLFSLN